jgi:hypothetical protein
MSDVEVACAPADFLELQHGVGRRVRDLREAKRRRGAGNQFGCRHGVSACEERHLMSLPHQLFRQVGNNPFGAAIEFRRNALNQW